MKQILDKISKNNLKTIFSNNLFTDTVNHYLISISIDVDFIYLIKQRERERERQREKKIIFGKIIN